LSSDYSRVGTQIKAVSISEAMVYEYKVSVDGLLRNRQQMFMWSQIQRSSLNNQSEGLGDMKSKLSKHNRTRHYFDYDISLNKSWKKLKIPETVPLSLPDRI